MRRYDSTAPIGRRLVWRLRRVKRGSPLRKARRHRPVRWLPGGVNWAAMLHWRAMLVRLRRRGFLTLLSEEPDEYTRYGA